MVVALVRWDEPEVGVVLEVAEAGDAALRGAEDAVLEALLGVAV